MHHIKPGCLVVFLWSARWLLGPESREVSTPLMTQQPAIHTSIIINSKAQNISQWDIDFDLNTQAVQACEDLIVM